MLNKKIKFRLLYIPLVMLFISTINISAYNIHTWPDEVDIKEVYGAHVIQNNGFLKSNVLMFFNIPENFTNERDDITIYFEPWERMTNEPIKITSIEICDDPGSWGWNYDTGYDEPCNESYQYTISKYIRNRDFIHLGNRYPRNYSEYRITFVPKESNRWQAFVFVIKYTVPYFIFKQGDYSVAWLNYPNMEDRGFNIENSLVLPTKEDVPRFIPEAKKIIREPYLEEGKIFYRWAFLFEGGKERVIWYWNDKQIKEKENRIQTKYMIIGALIGLVIAIILLFGERLFFDWLPYGTRINKWLVNKFNPSQVIGNINGKKYHRIDCAYVDNINERNKRPFSNKEDAESEEYTPCNLCNPNE